MNIRIKKRRSISILLLLAPLFLAGQASSVNAEAELKSGPMAGYSTMAEVFIWLQTNEPASVEIKYWPVNKPDEMHFTSPVRTSREDAFVAHCLADEVKAGTTYHYSILINDKEVEGPLFRPGYKKQGKIPLRFQTPPRWRHTVNYQPPEFRVATGSCAYLNEEGYNWEESGQPYGGEYEIFDAIYEKQADLMIWLGDNMYFREPDWTSWTGIVHRYDHLRTHPFLRSVFASGHHLAIWDDHDFGPNNSGAEFWNKAATLKAFKLYWGNPTYGMPENPGIHTFFNWADVNFYLMDNRYHRTTDQAHPERFGRPRNFLGRKQVDWLVDALKFSQNQKGFSYPLNFNIICIGSQVISDSSNKENYRNYRDEWQYLIDQIMEAGIDGVVFLTGDVHVSEFSREVRIGGGEPGIPGKAGLKGKPYVFYDLTVSPFTSGVSTYRSSNTHRLDIFEDDEMDLITVRNFATLDFTGPKEDRIMTIRMWDKDGNLINQETEGSEGAVPDIWMLKANELRAPIEE